MCKIDRKGKFFKEFTKQNQQTISKRDVKNKQNKVLFVKFHPLKLKNLENKSVLRLTPSSVASRPTCFDVGRVVKPSFRLYFLIH